MMSAIHHRKKKPEMYVFGVGTLIPCYQVEEVYAILDKRDENGKTVFHEGQRPVDVQNLYVISMDTLYEVVNEFFQTGKMPECILWT